MRFLVDAHHVGRRQTGNETWIRNVAASFEQVADGDELIYAITDAGRQELRALTDRPVHTVSARGGPRLLRDLPALVRALRPDAILSTYTIPCTARPCVLFVHDVSLEDRRAREWLPGGTRTTHRWATRWSCRRAAHVLVPSEHCRRDVVEKLMVPPDRVSIGTGAPDRDVVALLESAPAPARSDVFTVLSVGSMVARKNLLVLSAAVRTCVDAGVPVRWRVVGPVPRQGEPIAAAIRRLLGAHVVITGYVDRAALAAEYRAADALCFPSLFEGFGLPAAEAMAAGTPVVVSDATSLPEVVGGAGIVVPPGDVPAWAAAIMRLFDDPGLRTSLGAAGRARARQLSWDRTARIALDALRRAARPTPRGHSSVSPPSGSGE